MANGSETVFQTYLDETFPSDGKRTRSAIVRESFARKIVNYLKGEQQDADKGFRHFVKKSGFELLDLPSVGIRDALVIRVKEEKKVRVYSSKPVIYNCTRTCWHKVVSV